MSEGQTMFDENAFGLLMSYFDIEEDEYASDDTAAFVTRFQSFERKALEVAAGTGLPEERKCVCFGHAVYVEFPDPEGPTGLFRFVRGLSAQFEGVGFRSVVVLSHGGRWLGEQTGGNPDVSGKDPLIVRLSAPSEPLRRALAADVGARGETEGWGPGLFVDTEALEALKMTPKNTPTVLSAGGATFLRVPAIPLEEAS